MLMKLLTFCLDFDKKPSEFAGRSTPFIQIYLFSTKISYYKKQKLRKKQCIRRNKGLYG